LHNVVQRSGIKLVEKRERKRVLWFTLRESRGASEG